ncbi:MAG: DUF3880 domain-containing protein [Roseburia sp.]
MNILFLDSPAFAKLDMIDAFAACGIHVDLFFHEGYNQRHDPEYETAFDTAVSKEHYDFVFSFNYYPILSTCCRRHNLKYVSYVYDSPLVALYSYTVTYPGNYIFLFDKTIYRELHDGGISTVYYLPLASNTTRLTAVPASSSDAEPYKSDISFVGSLYNEEHHLYERLVKNVSPFTKGYLEGILDTQRLVYGAFLLEKMLTPAILADLEQSLPYTPNNDGIESPAYVYANYFLARKLAELDRTALLGELSQTHQVKLFTGNPTPQLPQVQNMGTVDYYKQMPLVFRHSRINLNISLRSIQSGIPLRAFDIMGSGGFLLSNYQADFTDCFTPGEDFVWYGSVEEAVQLCNYYLSHENERTQIAANGLGKIRDAHTFVHRARTILNSL